MHHSSLKQYVYTVHRAYSSKFFLAMVPFVGLPAGWILIEFIALTMAPWHCTIVRLRTLAQIFLKCLSVFGICSVVIYGK